nr:hypothetical protein CFP56_11198 [Quercus suber]
MPNEGGGLQDPNMLVAAGSSCNPCQRSRPVRSSRPEVSVSCRLNEPREDSGSSPSGFAPDLQREALSSMPVFSNTHRNGDVFRDSKTPIWESRLALVALPHESSNRRWRRLIIHLLGFPLCPSQAELGCDPPSRASIRVLARFQSVEAQGRQAVLYWKAAEIFRGDGMCAPQTTMAPPIWGMHARTPATGGGFGANTTKGPDGQLQPRYRDRPRVSHTETWHDVNWWAAFIITRPGEDMWRQAHAKNFAFSHAPRQISSGMSATIPAYYQGSRTYSRGCVSADDALGRTCGRQVGISDAGTACRMKSGSAWPRLSSVRDEMHRTGGTGYEHDPVRSGLAQGTFGRMPPWTSGHSGRPPTLMMNVESHTRSRDVELD